MKLCIRAILPSNTLPRGSEPVKELLAKRGLEVRESVQMLAEGRGEQGEAARGFAGGGWVEAAGF